MSIRISNVFLFLYHSRMNSEIRDFDIIDEKLQKYPSSIQRDSIMGDLKKIRKVKLKRAMTIPVPLKNTDVA